jgi:hypothetical protein
LLLLLLTHVDVCPVDVDQVLHHHRTNLHATNAAADKAAPLRDQQITTHMQPAQDNTMLLEAAGS